MDSALTHNHFQAKKNVPVLHAGDRVRVHQKIKEGTKERIQIFEGLVIKAQHGSGINATFTVRRIASGIGVERTFPLHLPSVVKIEKVKSAKVRQAKIFYVRGLIGKSAKRLKGEKEDAKVWEDVIEVKVEKDPEQDKIEQEIEEAEEAKKEVKEEPTKDKKEEKTAEETKESPEEPAKDSEVQKTK